MTDSAANRVLAPHGGYRRMFSYGYARILDRATAVFCDRAWTYFAPFFEEPTSLCDAANAALVLVDKTAALLTGQISAATKATVENGGFKERMTRARIERRDGLVQPPPNVPEPVCPECGRPMRLRTAKSGPNAGKPFWGCSGYPDCKGRRKAE